MKSDIRAELRSAFDRELARHPVSPALADRVLDEAVHRSPAARQPWLLVGAAAALAIAVVGVLLLGRGMQNGVPGGQPPPTAVPATPTPSPTVAPTPTVAPAPPAPVYGSPQARYAAALAPDSNGHLLLFGGRGADGGSVLGDTWIWDGHGWVQQVPETSPPGRGFAVAAYDPVRHQTLVFGGGTINADPQRNDTWVWDGTSWNQRHPANSPPAQGGRLLAYVPAVGRLVLLVTAGTEETWTWDGTTWTRVAVSNSGDGPGGGLQQGAAIDRQGRLVVFGGAIFGPNGNRNQTWAYDATGWHQLHPATTPTGGAVTMAYDAARGQLVMLEADGTWTWDGTDWTHRRPAHQPPTIDAAAGTAGFPAMAFDPATQRVVLLASGETWTWDGTDWTRSA